MARGEVSTSKATQTKLVSDVDLSHDYTSDTLSFQVGGITYDVDETLIENTPMNPLTKERFIDGLKVATDGTNNLGEVADIYFDVNDQLVIQAKTYGATVGITDLSTTTGMTGVSVTPGVDGTVGTISGSSVVTDADVLAETGKHTLVVQYDDVQKKIEINFDVPPLNTVADLETSIQTQLDTNFPPAGTVNVSAISGGTIDLSIAGINDGQSHTLSFDYIVSNKSELVSDLQSLSGALQTKDDTVIQDILGKLDVHLDRVLTVAGEIGGKTNRIEFIKSRVEENEISFTSLLSSVQDVDMAEAIMYFKNLENVYRASLSVGSKVIQPSLVDFIR